MTKSMTRVRLSELKFCVVDSENGSRTNVVSLSATARSVFSSVRIVGGAGVGEGILTKTRCSCVNHPLTPKSKFTLQKTLAPAESFTHGDTKVPILPRF